ncbi:rubredoxin [Aquimarina sp. 2201CG5-10]|uniref:rubredoxin n=1 Tax=Aquimarina callyspongiae TaxID=3098150 RepID=UPI002AB58E03|nr:rubredoxin [Aquimarina sp. 2201CG5-10]MDY8138167.1 rubredoxin [Aquimarina sp. 2201CG5-10]
MEQIQRVDIKGGILSPSELQHIIEYAEKLGLDTFHFGSRQDIIFPLKDKNNNVIANHQFFDPSFFSSVTKQNISCSYVSIDIFNATVWLRGTTYLYILEQFGYEPKLKINICDPQQQIVPLFSGDLNFIASAYEDYWYLFLKLPGWEEVFYPVLIFTWDIAKVAEEIEKVYQEITTVEELFQSLNQNIDTNNRVIDKPLKVSFTPFPYYEGMNKMGINQYWLGLYWRNNQYDLTFLKALCEFCVENRIGKICLTPWKSFIIKGIPKDCKLALEKLLGRFGINVRHSALELNWHLPVGNQKALELKKFLVMNFDQNDISTYGMTFSITMSRDRTLYFTSVIIEENKTPDLIKDFVVRPTYNVLHAQKFDPNTRSYIVYAQDIDQMDLPVILLELTKTYFQNLGETEEENLGGISAQKEVAEIEVYQCTDCQTIYDPSLGDPIAKIEKVTGFEDLPKTYCCSLCEAPKDHFSKITLEIN